MDNEVIRLQVKIGLYADLHKRLKTLISTIADPEYTLISSAALGLLHTSVTLSYKTGVSIVDKEEFVSSLKMSTNDNGLTQAKQHLQNEMNRISGKIQELKEQLEKIQEG